MEKLAMRIGFTCSTFDLLHAGHVLMLDECRTQCDRLIVGLQTDPTIDRPDTKNKPIQTMYERWVQLLGCRYVDDIIPYESEEDLMNILKSVPIDIRFVGEEYKEKDFTGKTWCADNGIEIIYNRRRHDFSTTQLRKRIQNAKTKDKP